MTAHLMRRLRPSVSVLIAGLLTGCLFIESPKQGVDTQASAPAEPASMEVMSTGDTEYLRSCRSKGVPIPPDWTPSSPEWMSHGNLRTILLTPNHLDKVQPDAATFATVWSYAPPTSRGACIALGRNGGIFQIICQSAETGYACFWSNDVLSPTARWTPDTVEVRLSSLRDPEQGLAPGTVPCTECHRGNNAFLVSPDDPTWAKVLRPEHARPTFTTRITRSSQQGQFPGSTITYPRFIPVGGRSMALINPLPTMPGCSGTCHEAHYAILDKGHTAEGYVRIPRPMGPACARNSPDDDPTRNCYR